METGFKDRQRRNYDTMRTVYNITMGIIILGIGIMILFADKLGISISFDNPFLLYAFSGLCILYGGFRLYRGIKKNN